MVFNCLLPLMVKLIYKELDNKRWLLWFVLLIILPTCVNHVICHFPLSQTLQTVSLKDNVVVYSSLANGLFWLKPSNWTNIVFYWQFKNFAFPSKICQKIWMAFLSPSKNYDDRLSSKCTWNILKNTLTSWSV